MTSTGLILMPRLNDRFHVMLYMMTSGTLSDDQCWSSIDVRAWCLVSKNCVHVAHSKWHLLLPYTSISILQMNTESKLFRMQTKSFTQFVINIAAQCCAEIDAAPFQMSKDSAITWGAKFIKAKVRDHLLNLFLPAIYHTFKESLDILTQQVPLGALPNETQQNLSRYDQFVADNITPEWAYFKYLPWTTLIENQREVEMGTRPYAIAESSHDMQFGPYTDLQKEKDKMTGENYRHVVARQNNEAGVRGSPTAEAQIFPSNNSEPHRSLATASEPRQLMSHPGFVSSPFSQSVGGMSHGQKQAAEEYQVLLQEQERIQSSITLVKNLLEESSMGTSK
jgi:hypothetical protein